MNPMIRRWIPYKQDLGDIEKEKLYLNRKRHQQNKDQGGANICFNQLGGGGRAKRLQTLNGAKHKLQ